MWVCDGVERIMEHPYDIIQYYDNSGNPTFTENQYTIDAYSVQDFVHMNWGWGATLVGGANDDGWYDCSVNYTDSPSSIDGISYDFTYFQVLFMNIYPAS